MAAFKLTTDDLKPHLIPAGNHYAIPSTGKKVFRSKNLRAFEFAIVIRSDSLFDYKYKDVDGEIKVDPDILDTHKIGGLHFNAGIWNNAKDTLLLGWRQKNATTLEFVPYSNKNGDFEIGNGVLSSGDELIRAYFERVERGSKTWNIVIKNENTGQVAHSQITTRINGYWCFGEKVRTMIGPYHGGDDNAPGPFGGVAPVPVVIGLAQDFYKY